MDAPTTSPLETAGTASARLGLPLPLPPPPRTGAQSQSQSPLFRLPAEVRLQIYSYLICGGARSQHIVHVDRGRDLFLRVPCRAAPDDTIRYRHRLEWHHLNSSPWRSGHLPCRRLWSFEQLASPTPGAGHAGQTTGARHSLVSPVPCLRACRMLHDEIADVLYDSLSFVGLKPLRRFFRKNEKSSSSTAGGTAGNLDRIRRIHIQWETFVRTETRFNFDFTDWEPTCDRLARLKSLQLVTVVLLVCERANEKRTAELLRPLQALEAAGIEVHARVVRSCWGSHSKVQRGGLAFVDFGQGVGPIQACAQNLRDYWPGDHVLEQTREPVLPSTRTEEGSTARAFEKLSALMAE